MEIKDFITRDESAMYYLCGYSADNAILMRFGSEFKFITDARYSTEAHELCKKNIALDIIESNDLLAEAKKQIAQHNIKSLCFDPMRMCVEEYHILKDIVSLIPTPNFTQIMRMQKTDDEINILQQAQLLNLQAIHTFGQYVSDQGKGKSEKYLWYKIADTLSNCGQYPLSFDPIVGIEGNAAKPHALPSDTTFLQNGDTLLLDCGLKYKRYCADCTRTALFFNNSIMFEKEQDFTILDTTANKHALSAYEKQKIYDLVKKAQMTTIENLRAGMSGKEIDSIARNIIEAGGYGKYFTHSTGHGIGLDIHEMPFISRRSETIIEDGMVFSIEPGIYIPQTFGVRIEDLVVVKQGKAIVLN
ncbi:M24 family metallopeptidase [Helicobacter trogontum]|uniref:M24 family metallopeptidase n=1 Tax=Helicobacter trogontum TaxID=50960 RepID=A0A4U8TA16_9HELI|nr:M24 family metallopeptidase [Helicobacter trogontum]MDY5184832.1 M24 family metallopeptidase [Helicobacter trogontum]TLD96671.1 M24 family metallopeptidase [Helicobacter trogontum]